MQGACVGEGLREQQAPYLKGLEGAECGIGEIPFYAGFRKKNPSVMEGDNGHRRLFTLSF